MDPRNPPRFHSPLVEYELDERATEVVRRHLEVAAAAGHRIADRILEFVSRTPGRVVTLAPEGTPREELNLFEGLQALHREHFAPWGHSSQWDEWVTDRLASLPNPYIAGLDLQARPSDSFWTNPEYADEELHHSSKVLFVDGATVIEAVQGPSAKSPDAVAAVIHGTDALWSGCAIAGASGVTLPHLRRAQVSSATVAELVGAGPRVVVVNPYDCDDGYLFWEPISPS